MVVVHFLRWYIAGLETEIIPRIVSQVYSSQPGSGGRPGAGAVNLPGRIPEFKIVVSSMQGTMGGEGQGVPMGIPDCGGCADRLVPVAAFVLAFLIEMLNI